MPRSKVAFFKWGEHSPHGLAKPGDQQESLVTPESGETGVPVAALQFRKTQ